MWAYLFWSLVAAWLFSLRPKREPGNQDRAHRYGEHNRSSTGCGHACCQAHSHLNEHSDGANRHRINRHVDPEISLARTEQNWTDAYTDRSFEASERGSVSP